MSLTVNDLEMFGLSRDDVDAHKRVAARIAQERGSKTKVAYCEELDRRIDESEDSYAPRLLRLEQEIAALAAKYTRVKRAALEERNRLLLAKTAVQAQPDNAADTAAKTEVAAAKAAKRTTTTRSASEWDAVIKAGVVTAEEVAALPPDMRAVLAIGLPHILVNRK